ncbi:MAG: hypothetical protein K2N15_09420 [Lachnospiraceae bacterium]|nr:hypothetical protein [Lachnospiraceae bacterium]
MKKVKDLLLFIAAIIIAISIPAMMAVAIIEYASLCHDMNVNAIRVRQHVNEEIMMQREFGG